MDWEKAWKSFNKVMQHYKDLIGEPGVNTTFALTVTFEPIARRYNEGERTQELYDEMMAVE